MTKYRKNKNKKEKELGKNEINNVNHFLFSDCNFCIRKRNFIEVPEDDEMRKDILKVPMRAGSLLIWNSQLPHGR